MRQQIIIRRRIVGRKIKCKGIVFRLIWQKYGLIFIVMKSLSDMF